MSKIKPAYYLLLGYWRLRHLRSPIKLVIGSAGFPRGWIHTDKRTLDLLKPEMWSRFFKPSSIDNILAEHVWEHLTYKEGAAAVRICYKYLKPGGCLRIAVPDGFCPSEDYIDSIKSPIHGHKILFDIYSLMEILNKAGFKAVPREFYITTGERFTTDLDPRKGKILRSSENGKVSLIIDGIK